jgi:hypothetical protein
MSIRAKKCVLKKLHLFFNPNTNTDPDRTPTFELKNDSDSCQKVNSAGLYHWAKSPIGSDGVRKHNTTSILK